MKSTRLRSTVLLSLLVFGITTGFTGCHKKRPQPVDEADISDHYRIRVLLFKNIRRCDIESKSEMTVTDSKATVILRKPQGKKIDIERDGDKILLDTEPCSGDITIQTVDDGIIRVNGHRYRGIVRIIANIDSGFDVINTLSVESYLDGVVGAEMPSYWEAEALKAQAVAARTYCLYYKQKYGNDRYWDVTKTQSTQVYRGVEAETTTVKQAVRDTYGQVMTCEYSDGIKRIFPAYYSSVCGGHTEDGVNVFGRDNFSCLTAVKCDYCKKVARAKTFYWQDVSFSRDTVNARLESRYNSLKTLEGISKIEIVDKGYLDRILLVKLIGTNQKSDTIKGEDLRIAVDPTGTMLKSAIFKIRDDGGQFRFYDGKGFGHGVGMCQCGAEGMARKGSDYVEILEHYYTGMELYYLDYSKQK